MALPKCFQAEFVDESKVPRPIPISPTLVTKVYDDAIRFIKQGKIKEAKNIVRTQHWPIDAPNRGELWLKLCESHSQGSTVADAYYQSTVKESLGDLQWPLALPAFADPVFGEDYLLSAEGQRRAERVLYIVSVSHPFISYCPILHPVASLLLHYLTEEQTYECVCALIEGTIVRHLSTTRIMYDTSAHTLMQLTKRLAKKTYNKLLRNASGEDELEKIFRTWQLWIFRGLPFYHMVRTMDCFLIEGVRALYRIAMAILISFVQAHPGQYPSQSFLSRLFGGKKSRGKAGANDEGTPDPGGFLDRIIRFCKDIPDNVEKFFKTAYNIQGVSAKVLNDQLLKSEAYVRNRKQPMRGVSNSSMYAFRLEVGSSCLAVKESKYGAAGAMPMGVVPLDKFRSEILSAEQIAIIWHWLPPRITMLQPELIYSTNEHGSSLTNFYLHTDMWEPTVVAVLTTRGERFGAYCSTKWQERRQAYFGTGETFLFTFVPEPERFVWVGVGSTRDVPHSSRLFLSANQTMIQIGAGNGMGLYVDQGLEKGRTEHCDTFDNRPLASNKDFVVRILEVFGFA